MNTTIRFAAVLGFCWSLPADCVLADDHRGGDKIECLRAAYSTYGEWESTTSLVGYQDASLRMTQPTRTRSNSPRPGVLEELDDEGRALQRWTVTRQGIRVDVLDPDEGSVVLNYAVSVPVCKRLGEATIYYVEEWSQLADPEAAVGSLGARSWDMRHEHYVGSEALMTFLQVRPMGSDESYRSVVFTHDKAIVKPKQPGGPDS